MRVPASCLVLLIACCANAVHAREIYKCTTPDGGVAFQDQPCAANATEAVLHVADEAPAEAAAEAPAPAPAAAPPPPPPAVELKPYKPLPAVWLCTNAEDGSHYTSRYGPPPPRLVPLGTLGYPGKSLAEAYAPGANVMSAPEFNKPPIDRSPGSALAAAYTQLQDSCTLADPAQTCAWLRNEYDKVSDKLRNARFKDEQAKLQPQVDELESDLRGC